MDLKSAAAAESSQQQQGAEMGEATSHHLTVPPGLTDAEFSELTSSVQEFHSYTVGQRRCSSLLAQRVHAPREVVWSIVRRFDKPQVYKHFIKACSVDPNFQMAVGCTRYFTVLPLLDSIAQCLLLCIDSLPVCPLNTWFQLSLETVRAHKVLRFPCLR